MFLNGELKVITNLFLNSIDVHDRRWCFDFSRWTCWRRNIFSVFTDDAICEVRGGREIGGRFLSVGGHREIGILVVGADGSGATERKSSL